MEKNWTAVQIDHWVTTINGNPTSLKKWPDGWVLARRFNRQQPALIFKSLSEAVRYLG